MTFGERIKELRIKAGKTQEEVYGAAGMARSTYLKYEQGVVAERVPFSAVIAISQALNTDCTAFADCDLAPAVAPPAPERARGKRK